MQENGKMMLLNIFSDSMENDQKFRGNSFVLFFIGCDVVRRKLIPKPLAKIYNSYNKSLKYYNILEVLENSSFKE